MRQKLAYLFLLTALLSITKSNAQKTYEVTKFSDRYSAKVFVPEEYEEDNRESTSYVIIYDKGKEIIRESVQVGIDYELDGKDSIISNIQELPYGHQSLIIYNDFNCDGRKDLAIKVGNFSCYGGPAFKVYTSVEGMLAYNQDLSDLAQNYCGFFDYDCQKKEIRTMTKSGCCWHQFEVYDLLDGKPVLREQSVEEVAGADFLKVTKRLANGKESIKLYPLFEYIDKLFRFNLAKRKKEILLFKNGSDRLCYCFLKDDGEVEFKFDEYFKLVKEGNKYMLTFSNEGAKYSVYDGDDEVGVKVQTGGKEYDMKGNLSTRKSTLEMLWNMDFDNLYREDLRSE